MSLVHWLLGWGNTDNIPEQYIFPYKTREGKNKNPQKMKNYFQK
jgi:hypothetical protein